MCKFFEHLFPWSELRQRVLGCHEDWLSEARLRKLSRKRSDGKAFRERLFSILELARTQGKHVPENMAQSPAFVVAYCWSLVLDYRYEYLLEARRVLETTAGVWQGLRRETFYLVLCFWLGDWKRAKVLAKEILERLPNNVCAWRILAYICWVETQDARLVGRVISAARAAKVGAAGIRTIMRDIVLDAPWKKTLCDRMYFEDTLQVRAFQLLLSCWVDTARDQERNREVAQSEGVVQIAFDGQRMVGWLEKENVPVEWAINDIGFGNLDEASLRASIHAAKEICVKAQEPIRKILILLYKPSIVEYASDEENTQRNQKRQFLLMDGKSLTVNQPGDVFQEDLFEELGLRVDPQDTAWIRQERILEQVHRNVEAQRWERNIAAIRFIPPSQRSSELAYHLAQAYLKTTEPGDAVRWEHTVRLYLNVENRFRRMSIWHQRIGYAYEQLGQYLQAAHAYEEVLRLETDHAWAKERLAYVRSQMDVPAFTSNFAQWVRLSWAAFTANEGMIRAMMRRELGLHTLADHVKKMFSPLLDRYQLQIAKTPQYYRVRISTFGRVALVAPLLYWLEHCPESVRQYWRFDVGVTLPLSPVVYASVPVDDLEIYVQENGPEEIIFTFYHESFDKFKEMSPDVSRSIAWQLLASELHEAVLVRWVGGLEMVAKRPHGDAKPVKLSELRDYLEATYPAMANYTYVQYAQQMQSYTNPEPVAVRRGLAALRHDIYRSSSTWPVFYTEWLDEETRQINRLNRYGLDVMMLAFTLDHVKKKEREKRARHLIQSFTTYVKEHIGRDVACTFGQAIGSQYTYVEAMVFDSERFIKAVRDWHRRNSSVAKIYYCSYQEYAKPTRISNARLLLFMSRKVS